MQEASFKRYINGHFNTMCKKKKKQFDEISYMSMYCVVQISTDISIVKSGSSCLVIPLYSIYDSESLYPVCLCSGILHAFILDTTSFW